MRKMIISNKTEMYKHLSAGRFGNRFRIWNSDQELIKAYEDGFDWLVGVRCVGDRNGLPYYHHKGLHEALKIGHDLRNEYRCPVKYYEASPDQFISIQGEFVEADQGEMIEWSTAKTHMRAAFAKERNMIYGPGARLILKRVLSEGSYEDFLAVGHLYPNAVIEFTAYEVFVGDIPGRNAVIWEVRDY